ncbi:DUF6776 family protein [Polycyclovorans algicola]|uniref:DUF6776 family protein n=1 Tax=Polycyclovorans algicola TaxID=616992 RepID=UPI0004A6D500|nr:DUF6776 family protein [Polycyclovorans algicola]
MNLPEIVIRQPKRRGPRLLWIAGLTALGVIALWGLFILARHAFEDDAAKYRRELDELLAVRKTLTQSLREKRDENEVLRDELAFLRQSQQVESEATQLLRTELGDLQGELLELREQLAFYRGIVSPDVIKAGVRVHGLKLSPVGGTPRYRYELVLVQAVRRQGSAEGQFKLVVEGVRDGRPVTVAWHELREESDEMQRYDFQYFQEFDGMIKLPAGLKPQRIRVQLIPDGSAPAVEEVLEWRRSVLAAEVPSRSP